MILLYSPLDCLLPTSISILLLLHSTANHSYTFNANSVANMPPSSRHLFLDCFQTKVLKFQAAVIHLPGRANEGSCLAHSHSFLFTSSPSSHHCTASANLQSRKFASAPTQCMQYAHKPTPYSLNLYTYISHTYVHTNPPLMIAFMCPCLSFFA